eukprot:gene6711-10267_t
MKVITLGTSAPGLPAIESNTLIVPSIRFSSRMVSAPRSPDPSEPARSLPEPVTQAPEAELEISEPLVEAPLQAPIEAPAVAAPLPAPIVQQPEPVPQAPPPMPARNESASLFEVDDTLANLSRLSQELTQQKLSVLKQEEALDQLRLELRQEKADLEQESQRSADRIAEKETSLEQLARTLALREEHLAGSSALNQTEQRRMDERARYLESQEAQLHDRDLAVRLKEQQLTAALFQLPVLRDNLRELDYLWREKRPDTTRKVTWAASLGDRSENADYQYNKKLLREIDRRVRYLRKRLEDMRVVEYMPEQEGKVFFGAWVEIENEQGETKRFRIVGYDEIYERMDYISIDSPMARALLRKEVDDEALVQTPSGEVCWWITAIEYVK